MFIRCLYHVVGDIEIDACSYSKQARQVFVELLGKCNTILQAFAIYFLSIANICNTKVLSIAPPLVTS